MHCRFTKSYHLCLFWMHLQFMSLGTRVCSVVLHLRALDHNTVCLCMCLLCLWRRQNTGQEKHMALLGYGHLLLLGHCDRFQDHYESTQTNDNET